MKTWLNVTYANTCKEMRRNVFWITQKSELIIHLEEFPPIDRLVCLQLNFIFPQAFRLQENIEKHEKSVDEYCQKGRQSSSPMRNNIIFIFAWTIMSQVIGEWDNSFDKLPKTSRNQFQPVCQTVASLRITHCTTFDALHAAVIQISNGLENILSHRWSAAYFSSADFIYFDEWTEQVSRPR